MKKNKIIITQPTFLPYSGYFSAMYFADNIILLDDVQFEKRSWQQRNRIYTNHGGTLITVPTHTKGKFNQKINEVLINYNTKWSDKILKSIYYNYKNTPFFDKYFNEFEKIFLQRYNKLIDLNINIIKKVNNFLGIDNSKLLLSSKINSKEKKFDLIYDIYKKLNGDELLTNIGTKKYFPKKLPSDMRASIFEYNEKNELNKSETKNSDKLSIIDNLFNFGPKTEDLIKNNLNISKY